MLIFEKPECAETFRQALCEVIDARGHWEGLVQERIFVLMGGNISPSELEMVPIIVQSADAMSPVEWFLISYFIAFFMFMLCYGTIFDR